MRIGLATDFYYPWIGGPSAAIHALAHGLANRSHDVFLLAPSSTGPAEVEHEQGVEITRVATVRVPFGYELRTALPPRGIDAWLDRTQPDVVNVHHPFPLSAGTVRAARRRRIPVVATNHTIPACSLWGMRGLGPLYSLTSAAFGKWIVELLRRCDAVATPTKTAARSLAQMGYERDVTVISNGIDAERFCPAPTNNELRRQMGLDERPIVLYTGRLDAEKEMDVWLRAAARVAEHVDAQFIVGGEGTDRRRMERLVVELGLARRTRFIGYVTRAQLPELYRLAQLYFITSPVELQSITTLEAAASGLPVVAVDAGALPELVENDRNGYLVMNRDWEGAARAVVRVLEDPERRRSMASRSRDIALAHAIDRTVDAYECLLERTAIMRRGDQQVERASIAGR